ncbi:MAG: hypothetical protein KAW41_02570 [Candidatus Diapherotrites archaeon]|nr:hypothetical protein [Candidatus Diapherotrites archaeon]
MARAVVHIASAVLLGGFFFSQGQFLAAYALALGAIFPDIDDILPNFHRSWITHTAFVPSAIFYLGYLFPGMKALYTFLPFFTLGIVVHVILDFVDYKEFKGMRLPTMPVVFTSLPPWVTMAAMLLPQIPFLLYGVV